MTIMRKLLGLGLAVCTYSCNVEDIALPGQETAKDTKTAVGSDPLQAKLEKNGFYLDASRLDETKIPDTLKDKVALFQIALQSGDQPVLGGQIEAFEPGDCVVTDVPWAGTGAGSDGVATATIASPGAVEGTVDSETGTGAATTTNNATGTKLTGSGDPANCVDKKIDMFGPNVDSNFFSIVINKTRKIALNIFADGYQPKIVTIDGSKAKFIVLNVELGQKIDDCYLAEGAPRIGAPVSSTGDSSDGNIVSGPWTCGPISLPPEPVTPPTARACEESFAPVCGQPQTKCAEGLACPEIARAPQSYENMCAMENDGATLIHEGKCTEIESPNDPLK